MYLFEDTETSDLLKKHLPLSDETQPWVVSLAAELCDADGTTLDFVSTRIRADGRKVRPGAEKVHGISSLAAGRGGIPEVAALAILCHLAAQAKYVIGFGLGFDRQVVEGVLIRAKRDTRLWVRPGLQFIDCMQLAAPVCRIPHKEPRDNGGYKWPSLDEACEILLGEPRREGHHGCWDDMQRGKRVFFELKKRGVLELAA